MTFGDQQAGDGGLIQKNPTADVCWTCERGRVCPSASRGSDAMCSKTFCVNAAVFRNICERWPRGGGAITDRSVQSKRLRPGAPPPYAPLPQTSSPQQASIDGFLAGWPEVRSLSRAAVGVPPLTLGGLEASSPSVADWSVADSALKPSQLIVASPPPLFSL